MGGILTSLAEAAAPWYSVHWRRVDFLGIGSVS